MREHLLVIERLLAAAFVVAACCWAIAILGSEYIGMYNMSFAHPVLSHGFLAAIVNVLLAFLILGYLVVNGMIWFSDGDVLARVGFWLAVTALLLPLINLQASNLLLSMGYEGLSDFLYAYRSLALIIGFVGIIMFEVFLE